MEVVLVLTIGLVAGFVGGLLGIGGGVILIPGMTLLLGVPQHIAQGVSLATIIAISLAGTVTHYHNRYVDIRMALVVAPAAVVFSWLGAFLAAHLDAYILSKLFALLPLYVGARLVLER